jgi:hypothetical protein
VDQEADVDGEEWVAVDQMEVAQVVAEDQVVEQKVEAVRLQPPSLISFPSEYMASLHPAVQERLLDDAAHWTTWTFPD